MYYLSDVFPFLVNCILLPSFVGSGCPLFTVFVLNLNNLLNYLNERNNGDSPDDSQGIGESGGGARDTPPPSVFWEKLAKIISLHLHLWGLHYRLGNPGFATTRSRYQSSSWPMSLCVVCQYKVHS